MPPPSSLVSVERTRDRNVAAHLSASGGFHLSAGLCRWCHRFRVTHRKVFIPGLLHQQSDWHPQVRPSMPVDSAALVTMPASTYRPRSPKRIRRITGEGNPINRSQPPELFLSVSGGPSPARSARCSQRLGEVPESPYLVYGVAGDHQLLRGRRKLGPARIASNRSTSSMANLHAKGLGRNGCQ